MDVPYRAAVVTVSDSVAQGAREDLSGPAVIKRLTEAGWTIKSTEVLPDDFSLLRERLEALTSNIDIDVVFTTGGTGVGPRDRTPEATTSVMERSLPGVAELMRREGQKKTPLAVLSRAVVGMRGKTLLVNLPGAPEGAVDSLQAVLGVLPHAIEVIRGEMPHTAPAAPGPAGPEAAGTPAAREQSEEAAVESGSAPEEQPPSDEEGLGKSEPV